MMKILMINVVCGIKSTGRICTNIAEELEKEGHEVRIAYGREEVPEKYQKYAVRIGSDTDVKLHGLKARLSDSSGFGSKKATKKFIKWVKEYDPDIIHMHNLHGYYLNIEEWFEYLRTCGKKILWTLHDCWAFSGHSAHCSFNGCERWITGCHDCPNMKLYPAAIKDRSAENWLLKKQLMDRIPNMTIITPSKWLADEVKKSFLAQYPVHVINNGIDTSVFRPHESTFKKDHGIENKIMVLAVSTEWTILKGYPDYLKLAEELGEDCKLVLVGLTKELYETLPKNIIGIERTNSIQELADIYSAADVFINLSYCETYPTVDLEAIACGTPVVTYAVGGGMEIVTEDAGKIVAKGNLNEVKRSILDLGIKKQPLKTDTSCMDNKETVKHYLEHIC